MSDRPPFPLALPQSCGTLHLPASLLWFFAGYSVPDYGEAGTFFIMLTLQPSFRPFNERSGLFSPLFLSPTRYAHTQVGASHIGDKLLESGGRPLECPAATELGHRQLRHLIARQLERALAAEAWVGVVGE